jgi:outer membrane protein OmpA-like peptidoglycan-associated protein
VIFVIATTILAAQTTARAAEEILSADQIAYMLSTSKALGQQPKVDLPSVTFEYNSAQLTQQAQRQLDELAKALEYPAFKAVPFTIGGHTDARGSAEYNQRLSERRANSVRDYLERRHDFPDERVDTAGYGKSRLLPTLPPTDASQRRVEITLKR